MLRRRWPLILVLALMPWMGCSKECDRCDSDDDCGNEFICVTFNDGSQRCGSGDGATQCRTLR